MGLLTSAAQMIVGPKTFQHDTVFKGKVRFEKEITRTRSATFAMDPATPPGDIGTLKSLNSAPVLVANVNPGASGWTTLSLAAYCPVGTKAVELRLEISGSSTADYAVISQTSARNTGLELYQYTVNTIAVEANGPVLVDSSRQVAYYASAATISGITIWVLGYYN